MRNGQMLKDLESYVKFLEGWGGTRDRIYVEHKFRLPNIHPRLHGTIDAWKYTRPSKLVGHVLVADLKFGAGVAVEVKNNKQLMVYALGVVAYLRSVGLPVTWVTIAIVQPRYDHPDTTIRTQKLSVSELEEFGRRLKRDLALVDKPASSIKAGPHCRWCRAKPVCTTFQAKTEEALGTTYSGSLPYEPQRLADALALSETLPSWKKSVHAFAYKEALRGRPPPGWKLVPKRSRYGGYALVPESDAREAAIVTAPSSEFASVPANLAGYPGVTA